MPGGPDEKYARDGRLKNQGSRHFLARLDESTVLKIKLDFRSGMRIVEMKKKYAISESVIGRITRGESWRHVRLEDGSII